MPVKIPNFQQQQLPFAEALSISTHVPPDSKVHALWAISGLLDYSGFEVSKKGRTRYNPRVILCILVMANMDNIKGFRKICEYAKYHVNYMYLLEKEDISPATLCRFKKKYKKEIEEMNTMLLSVLKKKGSIKGKLIASDGTKIQSKSSNKHSYTESMLEKREEKLTEKIKEEALSAKEVGLIEKEIEEVKKGKLLIKERKKEIVHKERQESHRINIKEPEAYRMSSIEANGYNVQMSVDVESGYIVSGYATTDRVDYYQAIPNIKKVEEVFGKQEERVYLFDAGYSSLSNLRYGEDTKRKIIINDPHMTGKIPSEKAAKRLKKFSIQHFEYNKKDNYFMCINGEKLQDENNEVYKCQNCKGCPYRDKCINSNKKENKELVITEYFKARMKALEQEDYEELKKERLKIEKTFGNLKWNHGMRRFRTKGLSNIGTEVSLWILTLNIAKYLANLGDKINISANILLKHVIFLVISLYTKEFTEKKRINKFHSEILMNSCFF